MPRLQAKSFDAPDQTRSVARAALKLVHLGEVAVGHAVWQPGWRWSVDLKPIAGTASCENHHLGYAVSGTLEVRTDAGEELLIRGGSAYEIPPGHDAWVAGEDTWDTIEFASARVYGADPDEPDERILATILFTDIVDSTAQQARLGDSAWRTVLLEHNIRMRAQLDRYRGREIVTTGDGFLALFDGAARAARCALAMTRTVEDLGIAIRAGLHTGEVAVVGGNARGTAVHTAARVAALAGPAEVLVSGSTRDVLDGSGLQLVDRGEHELKGIDGVRRLFAVEGAAPT
jgi:class 3 adenylate cyclase